MKSLSGYRMLPIEAEDIDSATVYLFDAGCLGTEETADSRIHAYFSSDVDLEALVLELSQKLPHVRFGAIERVEPGDWVSAWKMDFHGFALGERFFVTPSWDEPPETPRIVLTIDPERAFGTGTHDTTRLCLELLESSARPGMSAVDVGTDTGILAMAAAALGCMPVTAIEPDSEAASCARANIGNNRYESSVRVVERPLEQATPSPADLVVANLTEPLIRRELARLSSWVKPNGRLILSGLLVEQLQLLSLSLLAGFRVARERTAGEWGALLIERDAHA